MNDDHVGGSALTSPPQPMEFDKMGRKGAQRMEMGGLEVGWAGAI